MIEPNPAVLHDTNAEVIQGFFHNTSQIPSDVDMIVHSHFFEHIFDPISFVKSLKTLKIKTKLCFSVPALRMHLEQKFSSILNFEHTYLCTEEFIEWSLKNQGFILLDKKIHDNDHSIFYAFEKGNDEVTSEYSDSYYSVYKGLFKDYIDYNTDFVNKVNAQIENTNNSVFLFGGHFISLFTISFGLNLSKITSIIDNSKIKEGKRLYGTNLVVNNPKILKDLQSPIVILRAGVFNEEIKRDILTNINSTTIFLESI